MKTLLTLILLSIAAQAQTYVAQPEARPLANVPGRYVFVSTQKGQVFREVQVIRFTNTEVFFTHSKGMETLKLADMPVEMQKTYGFNPFASADPAVATPSGPDAKEREKAIVALAKDAVNIHVVTFSIEQGGMTLCEVYPMVKQKTNKRNFSGEYMYKEVESPTPVKCYVIGVGNKPPRQDLGMVKAYACGNDDSPFARVIYALTPELAYEHLTRPKSDK